MLPFPFLPANILEETRAQNSPSEFIYTLFEVHHVSQDSEAWWRVDFYAICLENLQLWREQLTQLPSVEGLESMEAP